MSKTLTNLVSILEIVREIAHNFLRETHPWLHVPPCLTLWLPKWVNCHFEVLKWINCDIFPLTLQLHC